MQGLSGIGSFWTHQVAAFARDFRVVTHDHRGTGQSSRSRITYSVNQMADDVLRLMDVLKLMRRILSATLLVAPSARQSRRIRRSVSNDSC